LGLRLAEEIGHLHPQLGQFLALLHTFSLECCNAFAGDNAVGVVGPGHVVDLISQFLADGVDAVVVIVAHIGAMGPLAGACASS
jgi:hypothetical protein